MVSLNEVSNLKLYDMVGFNIYGSAVVINGKSSVNNEI
jgi:hypothetical protein